MGWWGRGLRPKMLAANHPPTGRFYKPKHLNTMGHLQNIDAEVRKLRASLRFEIADQDFDALVRWVKERVLESYRNGLAARAERDGAKEGEKTGAASPQRSTS
jgi:hypothetical protein